MMSQLCHLAAMMRRLGWELALLRREQISEQQADWSVSEKNNLNKQA